MKKFLLASIIVATAICSYAADLKLTGDAYVRGSMVGNETLVEDDEINYNYYDYDFNLYAAIVINEQASVNFKLTYDKPVHTAGVAKGTTTSGEYLAVEFAYLKYKFNTGTILDTGLMSGGTWATKFGETESNVMRIKVTQVVAPELTFLAIIQKSAESGAKVKTISGNAGYVENNGLDAEKNDNDTYYLAAIIKAGPITIKPLLVYGRDGVNQADSETAALAYYSQTYSGQLGIDFTIDMLGFEGEIQYTKVDNDDIIDDVKTLGYYGNLFIKIDPIKVGFAYAYSSADEIDGTHSMGNDFNVCIVMDETLYDGPGLSGMSVYKAYAEAKIDAITIGVAGVYIANNRDWDLATLSKDATATEIDASISYAIDANITYTLDGGYAMTSDWFAKGTDADMYVVRHKLSAKF